MTPTTTKIIYLANIIGILLIALSCLDVPGVDFVAYLLVGWVDFLGRVGWHIRVRWAVIASTIVYAALFVTGSQLFLRWLYREMAPSGMTGGWRFSWTLRGFCLIILMFTAGLGAVGIVHQTAWLLTSPQPLYHAGPSGSRESANRVKCASNLRQIGLALSVYREKHAGKNPDDLATLFLNEGVVAPVFNCPSSADVPATGATPQQVAEDLKRPGHCSYIYLGKGLSDPIDPKTILAVEPLENHVEEGVNALRSDGTVEWLDKPDAEALLVKLGVKQSVPATQPR